jgi:hypothetical protein
MVRFASHEESRLMRHWQIALLSAIIIVGTVAVWRLSLLADLEMRKSLLSQTRLVAESVEPERIKSLSGTESDISTYEYLLLKDQFATIRAANPQCSFVYLMGERADGTVFFFVDDWPLGHHEEAPAGMIYDDVPEGFRRVLATGIASVEGPFTDKWGTFISGCVPLTDPDSGGVIAILAMDFDANDWSTELIGKAAMPVGLLVLALLAILFSGSALLTRRKRFKGPLPHWTGHLETAALLAVGIILTLFTAKIGQDEANRMQTELFRSLAESRTAALADLFRDLKDVELEGLAQFMDNSESVSPGEFTRFAEHLTHNRAVQGWEWIPAVQLKPSDACLPAMRQIPGS